MKDLEVPTQMTQPKEMALAQPAQQKQPLKPDEPEPNLPSVPESTTQSLEDAVTPTGRWTPFIESIKREAEGIAIATMRNVLGGKLLPNALEICRVFKCQVCPAEEDPVEAAESVPQSEPREAASPDIEPEPQEEPEPQRASPSPRSSPEPERFKTVEPEPKPKAQDAKVAHEPVTQQPQKAEEAEDCNKPDTTTKEEVKTLDEGDCGVPASCDAVKSCLMPIPHTPACLNSFNNLLKEHNITAPKLPPMPQLPTNLSQFTSLVTQLMPSLPPELSQEFF
ncbi:RNA polymerase II degradation factor 1-like [Salmo trutta]|uniref:RNA polymerase II degradation factor 1-like n=1 Tax=Salmo trutta TaxID=8032 RepID=UPI001130B470|nr:RNA polymerase II degradation factor 1-like [Salmo trutta]